MYILGAKLKERLTEFIKLIFIQVVIFLKVLILCQSNADLMFGGITIICGIFGTLGGGLLLDKMESTISNAFKVNLHISILIMKLHAQFNYMFFMYFIICFTFLASVWCYFSWGYILFQRILLQKSVWVYSFLFHWRAAGLCHTGITIC